MKLDRRAYRESLRLLKGGDFTSLGIVFDPDKHPRDLEGQFREILGAKIKLTDSMNVGDVPVGGWVRTANDKTFEVSKHGKWTTVYPIDTDGKRVGKHTVLPKDTQVERVLQSHQKQTLQQTRPVGSIPRHIDAVTKVDGTKIYTFTFPDGTKDTITREPAYSNDFPNFVRTAIAYKENGKYRVYWTSMISDTDGVTKKARELEGLGMEDVTVHPMLTATHRYIKREQHKWPKDSVKAIFGSSLLVDEPDASDVERTLDDIEYLPRRIAADLVRQNVKIHVGARTTPDLDDAAHLRRVQPRGYPSGKTWNDAGGCYSPMDRFVLSGRLAVSGSKSTVLHEVGHAVGHVLNVDIDPDLARHHRRLYPKLGPYYQQDGPGGRAGIQELWAESFAEYLKEGRGTIASKYDERYAKWMEQRVEGLMAESPLTQRRVEALATHGTALGLDYAVWRETVEATRNHKVEVADDWVIALAGEYYVRTKTSLTKAQVDRLQLITKNILSMYMGQP